MELLNRYAPLVHWLPRLALAGIFISHGVSKFMGPGMFPTPIWQLQGVVELSAGIFMIVGAFGKELLTRVGGLIIAGIMLGAIVMVHWPRWFFTATDAKPMGGMELQLLTATIGIYFLFKGNDVT